MCYVYLLQGIINRHIPFVSHPLRTLIRTSSENVLALRAKHLSLQYYAILIAVTGVHVYLSGSWGADDVCAHISRRLLKSAWHHLDLTKQMSKSLQLVKYCNDSGETLSERAFQHPPC